MVLLNPDLHRRRLERKKSYPGCHRRPRALRVQADPRARSYRVLLSRNLRSSLSVPRINDVSASIVCSYVSSDFMNA